MSAPKAKALRTLSREETARLLHWLKVLHAEECTAHCRVVEGSPIHERRCRQIQLAIDIAEGSR